MKTLRLTLTALALSALLATQGQAQSSGSSSLTLGLFERYLDALRLEFGVPGLSAVVVEDGRTWERGFGVADIAANVTATPTTPYPIAGLTESIGGTLVLYHCVDSGRGTLNDRVLRWTPFAEPTTTIGNLLTHTLPSGTYQYDPGRYSTLTDVAAECVNDEFDTLLADGIFDRFAMIDSVPGRDVLTSSRSRQFSAAQLDRYGNALRRLAAPYRLDAKHVASRSDYTETGVSASTGIVSSARDLAQFDAALGSGALLSPALLNVALHAAGGGRTGLGWFVQNYNNQRIVWQFGIVPDAYSSLIVKIPDRRITLVLLANSDSLTSSINPQSPDVTQSVFARTFLRLYIS